MPPNNEAQPNSSAAAPAEQATEQATTPVAPAAPEQPSAPVVMENLDAPGSRRYDTPTPGNQPPQTVEEQRDWAQRERTRRQYTELERRRLGRNIAQETINLDQDPNGFYDEHDARPGIKHEADVVVDINHRVQEINAGFLDQCLEDYQKRIVETERLRSEAKYGSGNLRCVREWLHETIAGKAVSVLGKGGIAAGIVALTSHNFLAPAGLLAAKKLGTDAILEGVQYGFEYPVLCRINELRQNRHNTMQQLQQVRNQVANRNHDNGPGIHQNADQININGAPVFLHDALERIIYEFDEIEREILEREQRLALVRTIGKSIRTVASLAWSASAIYNLFTEGLMLNLDGLADPTHAIGHMHASAAAHHIVGSGANPEVFHNVKVASDGMRFVYETGEQLSSGLGAIGGETHLLAGAAAAQAGIAAGALGAVAVADVPFMINDAIQSNRMRHTMHETIEAPLEPDNKKHEAVFTLTGRDALGPTSGIDHEMSELSGLYREREEVRKELDHKKEKMLKGEIIRVPGYILRTPGNNAPGYVHFEKDVYLQCMGWDEDGDGKRKNFRFAYFDAEAQTPIHENHEHLVDGGDGMAMGTQARADEIIRRAEHVADSYTEYFNAHTPAARNDRIREERALEEVAAGQTWRANQDFALGTPGGNNEQIAAGEIITIVQVNNAKTAASVRVRDAAGNTRTIVGANLTNIYENCGMADLRREQADRNTTLINDITRMLRAHGPFTGSKIARDMVFDLTDTRAGTSNTFVLIGPVDEEAGTIGYSICNYPPNGQLPANKNAWNAFLSNTNNSTYIDSTLEDFLNRFSQRNGANNAYAETLRFNRNRQ